MRGVPSFVSLLRRAVGRPSAVEARPSPAEVETGWLALNGALVTAGADGCVVETIADSGGYSAWRPWAGGAGAMALRVDVAVAEGGVGVALLAHDGTLLHERVAWAPQAVRLRLATGLGERVRGVLVRNMAAGRPSRARVGPPVAMEPDELAVPAAAEGAEISLMLRRRVARSEGDADGGRESAAVRLPAAAIALVVIDAWAGHELADWHARAERNMRERLAPLADGLRRAGATIVHAAHDEPIHPLLAPRPEDVVIAGAVTAEELHDRLSRRGARLLLYAGYKANMCVLTRPAGLLAMHRLGIGCALVRDASISLEAPWSLEGERIHAATVDFIELNLCPSISVDEVLGAI